MSTKVCSKCKKEKSTDEFQLARKEGQYRGACNKCTTEYRKESGVAAKSRTTDGYKKSQEKYRNSEKGKRTQKNATLLKKFGINLDTFQSMLKHQNNKCYICSNGFDIEVPQVDHCHSTGIIRGLLCKRCNLGLGHFSDNVKYLENAIKYLRKEGYSI